MAWFSSRAAHFFKKNKYPLVLILIFIWIGFICSISFMEAWLKFRAPNVTMEVGVGIGRLIFKVLNKIEWSFLTIMSIVLFFDRVKMLSKEIYFLLIPISIILIQTFLLLPILFERVEMVLQGFDLTSSFVHFYYIFLEIFKVVTLFAFGIYIFRHYFCEIE